MTAAPTPPVRFLNPFEAADLYRACFCAGTLPLPYKKKSKPPYVNPLTNTKKSFTGKEAPWPTDEEIAAWKAQGQHNICIRLAGVDAEYELIGIDVDHYVKADKDKKGGDQLKALEDRFGQLPPTWISSARTDGISGIRYFRVPRGLAFRGQVDKDIECISKGYRYAVVWPSIHTEGHDDLWTYWWYPPGVKPDKAGRSVWREGDVPVSSEIPLLPEKWLNYLTRGRTKFEIEPIDMDTSKEDIYQWAYNVLGVDEPMCPLMKQKMAIHLKLIREEATSHDKLTNAHANIIHLAVEGHLGWDTAAHKVDETFSKVCQERDKRNLEELRGELFRSLSRVLRKSKGKIDEGTEVVFDRDPCSLTSADAVENILARSGITPATDDDDDEDTDSSDDDDAGAPHHVSDDIHSGQIQMAYRMSKAFAGRFIHVFGIGWHYWDTKRWAFDDKGKSKRAAIKTLKLGWTEVATMGNTPERAKLIADIKKCESNAGLTGILSIASTLKPFATTVNELNVDPYLLNCANGTLDLKTMKLLPHNPADRITKVCEGNYDSDAIGETWQAHLEKVLPDQPVCDYLQRICGVALLGKVIEHMLPILTGKGRNGKSVFYEALIYAMGDYGDNAEPDLFMHREGAHPTGEMDLMGKRLVVVSENDKDRRLAEATMKRLTGGDPIKARHMRQDFVTFSPSHSAMLITNYLPGVNPDDMATWSRIRVIPFNVIIPKAEQNKYIGELMEMEADAILTWMINGWKLYSNVGSAEPDQVLVATEAYHEDSDDVGRFIAQECITDPAKLVSFKRTSTTGELYTAWEFWQASDGCQKIMMRAFGRALDAHGHPTLPAVMGRRERSGIVLKIIENLENIFDGQTDDPKLD